MLPPMNTIDYYSRMLSVWNPNKIIVRDCKLDQISSLPANIIDLIMEFMSNRDAARTCVLSKEWRYVWANHHSMILDEEFWDDLKRISLPKPGMDSVSIVNSILLHHVGHLNKFAIDLSVVSCLQHFYIDQWLSSLCRRGLKMLSLQNSVPGIFYQVPSWLFTTSQLTHLQISDCVIKTAGPSNNSVLPTPLLTSLVINRCRGLRDFNISAPKLASLTLSENDYLNLKPFLKCKGIKIAVLYSLKKIGHPKDCERVNLLELHAAWPMLHELTVDAFCLQYLGTGNRIDDSYALNLRYLVLCAIKLDSEMIALILGLLRRSPLLHTIEIWFHATNLEEVKCIQEPSFFIDNGLEQLRTLKMKYFTGSTVEFMFTKIVLQGAPMLDNIVVEENLQLAPNKRLMMSKKLLLLQQVFPKAIINFQPNIIV